MHRNMILIPVLGLSTLGASFAAGCASDGAAKPAGVASAGGAVDEQERKEQLRWTDQKGRYRPDLRAQGGAALR